MTKLSVIGTVPVMQCLLMSELLSHFDSDTSFSSRSSRCLVIYFKKTKFTNIQFTKNFHFISS